MKLRTILISTLIVFSVVFIGLQIAQLELQAAGVRALLLLLLTALYCNKVKHKRLFFFLFFIAFALAETLNFFSLFIKVGTNNVDYSYYLVNSLYILSYIFLIIQVIKGMDVKDVIRKFPLHIIILVILDISSVLVVTNTTKSQLNNHEYSLEFVYNAVIMLLLTVALINYIHKDDKKSMNLLLASIFIVFSEVIQLTYFYVAEINILNVFCSLFLVLAFLFFYLQARLPYQLKPNELHKI
ncbi:MAG: hypothetical protein R2812_08645 [Gelidibacter sp.]